MIFGLSASNFRGIAAVAIALTAVAACSGKTNHPPDSFRGIEWDSGLPPVSDLQKSVLKGCTAVVEQTDVRDEARCSHRHIQTVDIDSFSQRENVPPIFDIPVSGQTFTWSHGKFWSGEVFIDNADESRLAALRKALMGRYGSPTFENRELTRWAWPARKIEIEFFVDRRGTASVLFGRSD